MYLGDSFTVTNFNIHLKVEISTSTKKIEVKGMRQIRFWRLNKIMIKPIFSLGVDQAIFVFGHY